MLLIRNKVYYCTISHRFAIFHTKRGSTYTALYFQCETRSIVVRYHMSLQLSMRSEIHSTSSCAFSAKQGLLLYNSTCVRSALCSIKIVSDQEYAQSVLILDYYIVKFIIYFMIHFLTTRTNYNNLFHH